METIRLSFEDYHFLMELQQELTAQSNDGNADPVYWGVMETRKVCVPEGCGDAAIYVGDGVVLSLEEAIEWVNERIGEYSQEVQVLWKELHKDIQDHWEEWCYSNVDDMVEFIQQKMNCKECTWVYERDEKCISRETGAFITKRACQQYIDQFGYNHTKPHTYAMTAFRNFELERLLKILREGLDFTPAKSIWHKLTEDADPERFVVLSDCMDHISKRLRWPFAEFVRDSKKKEGICYTKWAYQDDIINI